MGGSGMGWGSVSLPVGVSSWTCSAVLKQHGLAGTRMCPCPPQCPQPRPSPAVAARGRCTPVCVSPSRSILGYLGTMEGPPASPLLVSALVRNPAPQNSLKGHQTRRLERNRRWGGKHPAGYCPEMVPPIPGAKTGAEGFGFGTQRTLQPFWEIPMLRLCGCLQEKGAPSASAVCSDGGSGGLHIQTPPPTRHQSFFGGSPPAPEGLCHLFGCVLWRPVDLLVDGGDECFLWRALLLVIFRVTEALRQKLGGC